MVSKDSAIFLTGRKCAGRPRQRTSASIRPASVAAIAAIFIMLGTSARATTITVDSLADPGAPGICTLRDAITAFNTTTATNGCAAGSGNDTIQFSVTGTILLGSTLPDMIGGGGQTLTIIGPTFPGITIDGGGKVGVMKIREQLRNGPPGDLTLNLNNLTIAHSGPDVVAVQACSGAFTICRARLNVTDCTFSENMGSAIAAGSDTSFTPVIVTNSTFSANGGTVIAKNNPGGLTIANSTFSANTEGVIRVFRATMNIINSTFFGNSGGAIFATQSGGTITSSTFSDNTASNGGGVIVVGTISISPGQLSFKSTILASSNGANCFNPFGTIIDAGYNISDDSTCGFAKTGSANNGDNIDPLLSTAGLANNGGPTQTIALLEGSPAIDAIPQTDCTDQASPRNPITTDQRGFPRPDAKEQVCDIGPYEFQDAPAFAGQPGKPNCHGKSVSALDHEFGSLNAAASALGFGSVKALQNAIKEFCEK